MNSTWTKADRNRLALVSLLLIIIGGLLIVQLSCLCEIHLKPALMSAVGVDEIDMPESYTEQRARDVAEAWTAFYIATACSFVLLPICIAWAVKTTHWGQGAKVFWMAIMILFNTLSMLVFTIWTGTRMARRRPPRPLSIRAVKRTERFLESSDVDREMITERQFQFLGRQLVKRRILRGSSLIMLIVSLLCGVVLAMLFTWVLPMISDMAFSAGFSMNGLAEKCNCGEIAKMAEKMDSSDEIFVSRRMVEMMHRISLFMVAMYTFTFAMTTSAFFAQLGHARQITRTIKEYLETFQPDEAAGEELLE